MNRIGCVIAVFTVSLLLAAPPAHAQDAAKIARGQQVYVAQKCAICHSVGGKGNAKGVLEGSGAKVTGDEIRQWIVSAPDMAAKTKATRKPPMKAYDNLSKEDLDALVAYIQSLKK